MSKKMKQKKRLAKRKKAQLRNKRQAEYKANKPKQCGGCRACCYVFELGAKPEREWCRHVTPTGCGCHDDNRPNVCKEYKCGYLTLKNLPLATRPDHSGLILTRRDDFEGHPVAMCSAAWKGASASTVGRQLIEQFCDNGYLVLVADGTAIEFFGFKDKGYEEDVVERMTNQLRAERDAKGHRNIDFDFRK